jgi:predicted metal-dependent phosphoesterase TrpH
MRLYSKVNRTEDVKLDAAEDGEAHLTAVLAFRTPGEYELDILADAQDAVAASHHLFAVRPDWAGLRPYKGDPHMHTTGSDGRAEPLAMASQARRLGMDFIAVTDHDKREPSLKAIQDAAAAGLDLLILPGEEVTIREVGGHILAIGSSACVGRLRHTQASDSEREAIAAELAGRDLAEPLTAELYSHAVWTVRKIRQFGALAAIAHPYWVGTTGKYYPPRAVVDQLLSDGLCDALELMGGSPSVEGNRLAVARYVEEAAAGRRWPVLGASDAHDEAELGRCLTVVLARELSAQAVVDAISARRSVACDACSGKEAAIYGPLDLVEYVYFLHREYFPPHDAICREAAATARSDLLAFSRAFWHS